MTDREQAIQGRRQRRHPGFRAGLGALPPAEGPRGCPERADDRLGRRRLRRDGRLRRPGRDTDDAAHRGHGPPLFQLPHDGPLLTHALEPPHGTQCHEQQHGLHHRGLRGLPGILRADSVRERHDRRGPERARLEHLRDRQVAPHARRRGRLVGVEGSLAARPRVRALLRVPRRRDEPVVSGPRLRQPHDCAAGGARGRVPPLEGSDRQGDRVRSRLEGGRARQALVHVLLPGLRARAAPRVQGVVGQVRRPLRRGVRGDPRDRSSRSRRSSGCCPPTPSCRRSTRTASPRRQGPPASRGRSSTSCAPGTR